MDQIRVIFDFLRIVRRRFALISVISVLGIVISGLVAYLLPSVYQAQARVLVERQKIPESLIRSTVISGVSERLQRIQQRLMARDNIKRMIGELGLFEGSLNLTENEKIDRLRWSSKIQVIEADGNNRRGRGNVEISAFNIKVTYSDPQKVVEIVDAFVETILAQNQTDRTERATETLSYFSREQSRLGEALSQIELTISSYKSENQDALPDSLDFRREEVSRLAENNAELDRQILALEGELSSLVVELAQAEIVPVSEQSPEERELAQLQRLLVQKRTVYADGHREIRALRAKIAALEASLPVVVTTDGESTGTSLREAAMTRQIKKLEAQIDHMEKNRAQNIATQGELERSIKRTPNIEMQLSVLQRRRGELQDQYQTIVAKRAEAETGERLETNQQAERFELIEEAVVPDNPIAPSRKKILVMGSGAAMGLAMGLVFLLEMMNPVIRSASQMQRQLELRPVVVIPYVMTRAERRWRVIRVMFKVVLIVVAVSAVLYAIEQHYTLEVFGAKIAKRTGLNELILLLENRF